MNGRLDGRVAIVTGASRGIGRAIAVRFAREGARVVAAQRTMDEGDSLVAEIVAKGGEAISLITDVRNEASVKAMVDASIAAFGTIDILCNNAGVGLIRSVVDTTSDEYDTVMDTNVRGVFLCMRFGIPPMLARGGSVINIASVASYVGFRRDAAYCTSKGAVLMLTRQAALDFAAQGVRVNAICPGFIETPMLGQYCASQPNPETAYQDVVALHPMHRLGTPDDVAGAAVYFASDDSMWVTGASLAVDGGLLTQ
jgi:NAD(P)-dependent dehydrogenase (short-subunit alcohol dehydrogenase family)